MLNNLESNQNILPEVKILMSDIHNRGVFAQEKIKEDRKIIEYKGEKI